MESMLAVIALIAVASFAKGEAAAQGLTTQPQIFAGAIANFLSVIGLPHSLVFTLINLAVSAFALTSLDSVARVGRLSFQEFFLDDDVDQDNMSPFLKVVTNKYFATVITLVLAYFLTKVGYAEIWPLFGSANQLLSVLALVACAVFLKKTKRQGFMLWGPMVFMMAVTFTALGSFCGKGFYGLKVHQAALDYGVKVTGATVHYVNEVTDGGSIILQKAVYIEPDDTPETLQRRVMEQAEWELLPKATAMVCQRIQEEKDRQ